VSALDLYNAHLTYFVVTFAEIDWHKSHDYVIIVVAAANSELPPPMSVHTYWPRYVHRPHATPTDLPHQHTSNDVYLMPPRRTSRTGTAVVETKRTKRATVMAVTGDDDERASG
jgi:hypothetical protein